MNHDLPDPVSSSSGVAPETARRARRRVSLLGRISLTFGRVPAFGYGIAFLMMIPLYAFLYFVFFPNDFYHATVTREQQYFTELATLEQQLHDVVMADLVAAYGGNVVTLGNDEVLCLDRIQTAGFTIGELGAAFFKIIVPISSAAAVAGDHCPADSITSVVVVDAASDLAQDFPLFADAAVAEADADTWLSIRLLTSESQAAWRRLFAPPVNASTVRVSEDGVRYQFAVPAAIARQIETVLRASHGFPAGIPGEFARMLYLSAITATTTGYGDIVPITIRARMLTISEAILGLVLVGLFLNSIAQRRAPAEHR